MLYYVGGNNATNSQGMNEIYEYYEKDLINLFLTSKQRMQNVTFSFAICVLVATKTSPQ